MHSKKLFELKNAGIKRADNWLVRGVDLAICDGEIVTLIGPNGSGKSTTAKMALGIHAPDEGSAWQRERLRVGYVPQKLTIDWTLPLTVGRFMNLTTRLNEHQKSHAMATTGIEHLTKANMQDLSGGEFQRALLARAIATKPDLLVLDEPVQGVDFNGEMALYNLIQEVRDQLGCGVLMISHDLHVVMAATDRVLCLNGHVCCSGTPTDVVTTPAYRDLFGVEAGKTLAVYEHSHDHEHLPDGRVRQADGSIADHCHPQHDHRDHAPKPLHQNKEHDHVG